MSKEERESQDNAAVALASVYDNVAKEMAATASTASAPFAPPLTNAEAVVGESVVPSLMQVYESMTGANANETESGESQAFHSSASSWFPGTMAKHNPLLTESNENSSIHSATSGRSLRKRRLREPSYTEGGSEAMTDIAGTMSSGSSVSGEGRSVKSRRKSGNASALKGNGSEGKEQRSATTNKNSNNNDGRWSKRFTWPDELHRDFVAAIFDVGLKHSSPSTLLEQMPKHEQITTERIKSHLQKYRLHRVKSKKEFMVSYDSSLSRFQSTGVSSVQSLSSGQVAGHLTYQITNSVENDQDLPEENAKDTPGNPKRDDSDAQASGDEQKPAPPPQESLVLPRLTEAEKSLPIGSAMGYLMGLFFSLKQQLLTQRAAEAAALAARNAIKESPPVGRSLVSSSTAVVPIDGVVDPLVASNASPAGATPLVPSQNPSTRTNLEQNNLMKREMQSQMVFQNKMRALKQQELNKYKGLAGNGGATTATLATNPQEVHTSSLDQQTPCEDQQEYHDPSPHHQPHEFSQDTLPRTSLPAPQGHVDATHQGAGEPHHSGETFSSSAAAAAVSSHGTTNAAARHNNPLVGGEDFWNTDMLDDQLFEFLMSDG